MKSHAYSVLSEPNGSGMIRSGDDVQDIFCGQKIINRSCDEGLSSVHVEQSRPAKDAEQLFQVRSELNLVVSWAACNVLNPK